VPFLLEGALRTVTCQYNDACWSRVSGSVFAPSESEESMAQTLRLESSLFIQGVVIRGQKDKAKCRFVALFPFD
jgi:hypothetical protein